MSDFDEMFTETVSITICKSIIIIDEGLMPPIKKNYGESRHFKRSEGRSLCREITYEKKQQQHKSFIKQSKTNRQEHLTCNKWVSGHY